MTYIQENLKTFIDEETSFDWRTDDWKNIPFNHLYDFFDRHEIYVSIPLVTYKRGCDFIAEVAYRRDTMSIATIIEGEWEERDYTNIHRRGFETTFSTRKEAEIAAFQKAFEIAEEILQK